MKRPILKLVAPGFDGRFELGTTEVDDPLYTEANYRQIGKPQAKVTLPANVKSDVFMYLRQHEKIERHQWVAGMRLMGYLERLSRSAQAIDTTKEPVDGRGGSKDPFLATLSARRAVQDIRAELGRKDFAYIEEVIGDPFTWITLYVNCPPWHKKKLTDRVRGILEILAGHFGYYGGRD